MAVQVQLKYLRVSPRKARLVADLIRGKTVEEAQNQLRFAVKKAAGPFQKLLDSAVATAEKDFAYKKSNLYLSEVRVDEGPTLKRVRARAKGAFRPVNKRTSHLVLKLGQIEKREVERPGKTKKPETTPAPDETRKQKKAERRKEKSLKRAPKGPKFDPKKKHDKSVFRRKSF